MDYAPQKKKLTKGQVIAIIMMIGFVLFGWIMIAGFAKSTHDNGYNGQGTVISKDTGNKKCYLEIKRDDGKTVKQSAGWRKECGKYDKGQTVYFDHGIIDDKP
jgi:major membrane immunogen (membrane-anchored lipoprotein)